MNTLLVIVIGLLAILLAFESSRASRFSREVKIWKGEYHSLHKENMVLNHKLKESERLSNSVSALNIEVDATKEKLQKSEDMSQRRLKAYDECRKDRDRLQEELRQLRESLPKRDSKGRFCKGKEESYEQN